MQTPGNNEGGITVEKFWQHVRFSVAVSHFAPLSLLFWAFCCFWAIFVLALVLSNS